MAKLFANSGDPDQTPHPVASDLGLHCLSVTLLGVSRHQWVKSFCFLKVESVFNIHVYNSKSVTRTKLKLFILKVLLCYFR